MSKHLQAHELYEKDGYAPLPAFLSKQLVRTVYERTVQELNLQKPRQEFVAQGNLLTKPAIEVYSHTAKALILY